jgi:AcrR family transcriptional regulator
MIETTWKAAPMSDRDLPARERILVATIACLERDGIGAVTTRAIAR